MQTPKLLTAAFCLILLGSLFQGCVKEPSSSVDQDKIFTDYELFYDANADKTYARATFRFSNATGTQLELSSPASVEFNGDPLTFNGVLAYYEKEYAGLVSSGSFTYTDLDQNKFTNSVEIHTIGLPASLDSIPRTGAFSLPWTGAPLALLENVTVAINNQNAVNPQLFFQNDIGSTAVVLAQNQLTTLFAGNAIVIIDRRYVPLPQQATSAGALVTGRYRAKNQNVVLHD